MKREAKARSPKSIIIVYIKSSKGFYKASMPTPHQRPIISTDRGMQTFVFKPSR